MTSHPTPSDFEARTNATYAALMWALSRPGVPRDLPGPSQPGIVEALLDRECKAYCADPDLAQAATRTGAALVTPERADHLFLDSLPGAAVLWQVALGSDLHPESGATVVCNARLRRGPRLRLTGPGCNGAVDVQIDGLPDGFWRVRAQRIRYPTGFELFLVDGAQVLGVPRSSQVEVC